MTRLYPEYLLHWPSWHTALPLIYIPIIFFVISFIYLKFTKKDKYIEFLFNAVLPVIVFSMLGFVVGFYTGFSISASTIQILPAVLNLFAGFVVYQIRINSNVRILIYVCTVVFISSFAISILWGSYTRADSELFFKSEQYRKQQAFIEYEVREFRKALELGDETIIEKKPK